MMVMPKKTRIGLQFGGSAAESASHSGSYGRERRISISRWMTWSTQPPM